MNLLIIHKNKDCKSFFYENRILIVRSFCLILKQEIEIKLVRRG